MLRPRRRDRKAERERGTARGGLVDPDRAAHGLYGPPHDVQAEPDALLRACEVIAETGELVEDPIAVDGRYAAAAIDDGGDHALSVARDADADRGAVGRELGRVREQVLEHLHRELFVGNDAREL